MRKWILIGLAVLLLALAGLVAMLVAGLDSYLDENRAWLAAQAEAALGRSVHFDRIGVSFMGGLGVEISGLEVGDDPAFSSDPFLKVEEVMVLVRLWPALMGRYEVEKVALLRPDITLRQTPAGNNTDSLGAGAPTSGPGGEPGKGPEPSPAGPQPMLVIALAELDGGRVRLLDTRGAQPVELVVEQLDVEVGNISSSEPVSIEMSAALFESKQQNLSVKGTAGPLDREGGTNIPLDLELRLDRVVAEDLMRSPLLAASLPSELSMQGSLDLRATLSGRPGDLRVRGSLEAIDAILRYADLVDKPRGTPLSFALEATVGEQAVDIGSWSLRFGQASFEGAGRVALSEPAAYAFDLTSRDLPLDGWDALIPSSAELGLAGTTDLDVKLSGDTSPGSSLKLAGTAQLKKMGMAVEGMSRVSGLTGLVTLAGGGATLPASALKLGGAPVTLAARIADLTDPVFVFDLSAAALTPAALGLADDSGFEVLRDVSLVGDARSSERGARLQATLRSGSGIAGGFDYQQLVAKLRYAGEVTTLDSLDFQAYRGTINASGSYDASRVNEPRFDVKAKLRGVRLEAFAASRFGAGSDVLQGALNSEFNLSGRGPDADAIKRSLLGNGRIELAEGALRNVNIAESALQAVTGVPGLTGLLSPGLRQRHPGVFSTGDTVFDTLTGALDVRDGRLQMKTLDLAATDYGLKAGGSVGLDGSVDIMTTLTTSRELTQDLIGESKTVRYITGPSGRIEVPVKLGGTLSSLKVQPNVDQLVQRAAQNAATTALTDLLNKQLGNKKEKKAKKEQPSEGPAPDDVPADQGAAETDASKQDAERPVDPIEELLRRAIKVR